MADDPLAKWRRPGSEAQTSVIEPAAHAPAKTDDGGYAYLAFSLLDKGIGEFISVVRASGMVRCFSYNGLVEIAHDGEFGSQLAMVFNFGPVVFVYGRNLSSLALGLLFRRIETITEFDASRWPAPKDASAPFVEKIEIDVKNMADAIGQVQRIGEKERQ